MEWEEKRLEAEHEEKRLEVEREMEHKLELRWIEAEEKAVMKLERARLEYESEKGERENRSSAAKEVQRSVRIAQ